MWEGSSEYLVGRGVPNPGGHRYEVKEERYLGQVWSFTEITLAVGSQCRETVVKTMGRLQGGEVEAMGVGGGDGIENYSENGFDKI